MAEPIRLDPSDIGRAIERVQATHPEFHVAEQEIRGIPYRIFDNVPSGLPAVFADAAARHGEREFLVFGEERLSFAEVWRRACRLAHALDTQLGVRPGEKVALAMRNFPEWCICYMAVIALGGVIVPLNSWWKREELRQGLADCGARVVFVDAQRLGEIRDAKRDLGLVLILVREEGAGHDLRYEDLLDGSTNIAMPVAAIRPEDDFCILYTSGSTGSPKGVLLTHRSALSALYSNAFMLAVIKEAQNGVDLWGDDPSILLGIPLFHVTGSHVVFLLSFMRGRKMVMMYRWDAKAAVALIRQENITNFLGVPIQSFELMQAAGGEGLPSLVDIGAGGAKRPADQVAQLREAFPNGSPSSGYGLTETNALGCMISRADYVDHPDSVGRPLPPVTDLEIVADGEVVPAGGIGEIWIKSPANFRGYHDRPVETAAALTPDGWFRTGDLGRIDENGLLYIEGRIKELIIRGGENISCLEVENSVYEHGAVAEAVAFSVPEELLGECVGLAVCVREGHSLEAGELRAFLSARLAAFKIPERIWLWPGALPRLGTGKFDKIVVRQMALEAPPSLAIDRKRTV